MVGMFVTWWKRRRTINEQIIAWIIYIVARLYKIITIHSYLWFHYLIHRQTHHIRSVGVAWSIIYGSFKSVTVDSAIIYTESWTNCFDRKTHDILSCIEWKHLSGKFTSDEILIGCWKPIEILNGSRNNLNISIGGRNHSFPKFHGIS